MSKPMPLPTADDIDVLMKNARPIRRVKTPPTPPTSSMSVPPSASNGATGGNGGHLTANGAGDPTDDAWPDPTPLDEGPTPPPFPLDAIYPEPARAYVRAVAAGVQIEPALPAMIYLGLASGCVCYAGQGRRLFEPKPDWFEQPNLYVAVALPPGERKSNAFSHLVKPIEEHERALQHDARGVVAQAEAEQRRLRIKLEKAEKVAADDDTRRAEVDTVALQLDTLVVPRVPRLLTDDVTPERLATLMADHGGRIIVASAECDLFGTLAGRYSDRGPTNLGPFLKGHTGDLLVVDRQGKPALRIDRPLLTLAVCCQPDALGAMLSDPTLRGRGMNDRWLYAKPRALTGTRQNDSPAIPSQVAAEYQRLMRGQLAWEQTPIHGPISTAPASDPRIVTLSSEARALFDAWRAKHERELGSSGRLGEYPGWGSKLPGTVVRIAGVMTLMGNPAATEIDAEIMGASLTIGDWLVDQALIVFGDAGLDPDVMKAKRLLGHLKRRCADSFTKSLAWQWVKGPGHRTFGRAADLDGALEVLEAHGWIGRNDGDGRRWTCHPNIWTK